MDTMLDPEAELSAAAIQVASFRRIILWIWGETDHMCCDGELSLHDKELKTIFIMCHRIIGP